MKQVDTSHPLLRAFCRFFSNDLKHDVELKNERPTEPGKRAR